MSAPEKRTASGELEAIEDALVESILEMDDRSLREEFAAAGIDPHCLIAEIESTVARAKLVCAKQRLESAKRELAEFRKRSRSPTAAERVAARERFDRARGGDKEFASKMMMAARKGDGPSKKDLESFMDDIAQLRRLEQGDQEE